MSTLNQQLRELAACSIEAGGLKPDARVVLIEQIELTIQANESSDGEVSGEPVAWRWRTVIGGSERPWHTTTDRGVMDALRSLIGEVEIEPLYPPAAQAVPNDDTGHEWATRHHLFIYEVDFGEEGKGRYIRLSDFNKVCEKLERAAQAMPEDMCLVTKEDGNNYCLILTALGMEEEGDPVAEVKRLAAADAAQAVPMLLYCPMCGSQHIDAPGQTTDWDNPPHRSHLCHSCGCIWRPADVATVGVAAIETKGLADTFDASKGRELPRDDAQAVPVHAAVESDAAKYRFVLESLYFDNDQDPDSGIWYSHAYFKKDSITAPGSPYYDSADAVIEAALAAKQQESRS